MARPSIIHPEGKRKCSRCKQVLELSLFYERPNKPGKYRTYCKPCEVEYQREFNRDNNVAVKARYQTYREKNRRKRKGYYLKSRYGITWEEHDKMYTDQKGCCASCKESGHKLVIDHCHKTKKVRGLLCTPCNLILGIAKESQNRLRSAALYLEKTSNV